MDVVILIGSASDLDVVEEALDTLKKFGVEHTLEVTSAHRSPERTVGLDPPLRSRGGRSLHRRGRQGRPSGRRRGRPHGPAGHRRSRRKRGLGGLDALLSTVQMPKGIPVATMGTGKTGAANAALLAVQILALKNPVLRAEARRLQGPDGGPGRSRFEEGPPEFMTSFFIQNFGCRVNQAEAFDWAAEFQKRGWRLEDDAAKSKLVVVNTCTLTARADRDGRKFIRKIARDNPGARIVVTGCLAERDPEGLRAIPGVWLIIPNAAKSALPEPMRRGRRAGRRRRRRNAGLLPGPGPGQSPGRLRHGLRLLRHPVRPRPERRASRPTKLLERDRAACRPRDTGKSCWPESISVPTAGISGPRLRFWNCFSENRTLPGDFRVRLSSLDPRLLPGPLLDVLTGSRRIAPHFHLSLQHGSDRILRAMGRESTSRSLPGLVPPDLRRAPEANLGADFIVGFPGETEKDFEATAALLEETPLGYAHVFSYSARPGRKRPKRRPLDPAVVKSRADGLRRLSEKKNLAYRRRFVGRTLDGIVIQRKPGGVEILTSNYLEVLVPETGASEGSGGPGPDRRRRERSTAGEICDNDGLRP